MNTVGACKRGGIVGFPVLGYEYYPVQYCDLVWGGSCIVNG